MAIGWIELLIVFFPMVLLAVGGMVALIVFPKTRRWGIALASTLGILAVLFLVATVGMVRLRHAPVHRSAIGTVTAAPSVGYQIAKIRSEIAATEAAIARLRASNSDRPSPASLTLGAKLDMLNAELEILTQRRQNVLVDGNAKNIIDFDAVTADLNGQPRPVQEQAVAGPTAGPTENPHGEHDPAQPAAKPTEPAKTAEAANPAEAADSVAPSEAAALADNIEEINKTHADIEKASSKPSSRKKASESKRPDWVDAPPGVVDGAYQTTVVVGPYTTSMECNRQLPNALSKALSDYVLLYLGSPAWNYVSLPNDYVLENIVKGTWEENKQTSVGPMKQLHVRLVFDRKTNELIKQTWDNSQRERRLEERLIVAGAVLACVLGLMLVAFVVLKIDIKTKGAYRKHLALGMGGVAMLVAFGLTLSAAPSKDDGLVFLIGISLMAGIGLTLVKKTRLFGLILLGILLVSLLASMG